MIQHAAEVRLPAGNLDAFPVEKTDRTASAFSQAALRDDRKPAHSMKVHYFFSRQEIHAGRHRLHQAPAAFRVAEVGHQEAPRLPEDIEMLGERSNTSLEKEMIASAPFNRSIRRKNTKKGTKNPVENMGMVMELAKFIALRPSSC